HDDIRGRRIGFRQRLFQHVEILWGADSDQLAIGFGQPQARRTNLIRRLLVELLEVLVLLAAKANLVEMLRRDKGNQKQACKCDPANRRHFFGEKIQQRGRKQDEENGAQENRKLDGANADVQRNLE